MDAPKFLARMSLESDAGVTLSDTRIRLLEEIARHGSINRAAKAVPLSYKAAWDAVDTMNNLSPAPLVLRVTGGRQGGGTQLTEYGRQLIAMYRALEAEYQAALNKVSARMDETGGFDMRAFRQLMHRIDMKCSARNQLLGTVCALREGGAVDFEVGVRVDEHTEVVAVITRTSAENLGLRMGQEVLAMIKAPSVMIGVDRGVRLSTRNQLWGEVTLIHEGPVNDEVTLTLPSGRTLTAVLTHASRQSLGIEVGTQACALFKASSVLLAAFG